MRISEYIYQSRILLGDTAQPFAWTDEEFAIYTQHAYREMARLARCIPDRPTATGSRALCTISLLTGVAEYSMNKYILDVYSIKHSSTAPLASLTSPLIKVTEPELDM